MKLLTILTALATSTLANPLLFHTLAARDVDPSQVPDFGVTPGQDPDGGSCAGANGVRIPCDCPPDRSAFIAKLNEYVNAGNAQGTPVSWATGTSCQDQQTRLNACAVTLQNYDGAGTGCPVGGSAPNFISQPC